MNKNERDGSKENYEVNYKLYVYIFQPFFSILGKRELKKCNKGEIRNKIAMYQRTTLARDLKAKALALALNQEMKKL